MELTGNKLAHQYKLRFFYGLFGVRHQLTAEGLLREGASFLDKRVELRGERHHDGNNVTEKKKKDERKKTSGEGQCRVERPERGGGVGEGKGR